MCGRFTQAYTWRELVALYGLTKPARNLQPRYNIAPTTPVDVLIPRGTDRLELWPMRWGLIPWWWEKTAREVPSTFNARAETVTGGPMFCNAFRERRCIIPTAGSLCCAGEIERAVSRGTVGQYGVAFLFGAGAPLDRSNPLPTDH